MSASILLAGYFTPRSFEKSLAAIAGEREQPQDAAEQANWLPAPEGVFYMALRIYWPKQAALDGTWAPPPVVRKV